jgi:hypothetical protein
MNCKILTFSKSQAELVLTAALLLTLTACTGYVEGPRAEVAVESPSVEVQDDYIYYPTYGIYYSGSRRQYAYLERGAWVSQPAPRGVSVAVLRTSPSVRMDFHDSSANHHAAVARQYPKNWKPAPSNQERDNHDEHNDR